MFTGIIEEVGEILEIRRSANSASLKIKARKVLEGTGIGDSIAVNGICLTVTSLGEGFFTADVMHETLSRTSLRAGKVNLERALRADGRFGGHIVSGHIDGVVKLSEKRSDGIAIRFRFKAEPKLLRYVAEKGSVAIDGVSLTIAKADSASFEISAIPHTLENTTLIGLRVGECVNLETDILAKYTEKLLSKNEGLSEEFLKNNGF